MTRLNHHGTELGRLEFTDCRIAIMSDAQVLRSDGAGWKLWKRVKAGVDPFAFATKIRVTYDARPAEFHAYMKALAAACDLEHRAQLNALVDQMPEDPDAAWRLFDGPGYDLQIEDVVRWWPRAAGARCRELPGWQRDFGLKLYGLPAGGRGCTTALSRHHIRRQPSDWSAAPAGFCYAWVTMSAINGDKARFHRERKNKLARRERSRELQKKLTVSASTRPNGRDL